MLDKILLPFRWLKSQVQKLWSSLVVKLSLLSLWLRTKLHL